MRLPGTFKAAFVEGMRASGENIVALVNCVLLLVVYVFGIGLPSLFAKLFLKKTFLVLKLSKDRKTYWLDLPQERTEEDHYRQF